MKLDEALIRKIQPGLDLLAKYDASVLEAYQHATYWVYADEKHFAINVGRRHMAFDTWLKTHRAKAWAFITACNPRSRLLTPAENRKRQARLARAASRWQTVRGVGAGRAGDWPPEESLLIMGIDFEDAVDLARRFEQNAIVWGYVGAPAELIPTLEP